MKGLIYTEVLHDDCFGGTLPGYEVRGMYCNYFHEPIQKGKEAVYFKECETQGGDGYEETPIPFTCRNYETNANLFKERSSEQK